MTQNELLQRLPKIDGVYIIFSTATRCPYLVCNSETFDDEAMICMTEEIAKAKVEELRGQEIPVNQARIDQTKMLGFFNEFFAFGINAVRFIDENEEICIQLDDIIKRGDMSKLPENKRPIENPILQLSMLYFTQEVRMKNRDMKKVHELEEEMVANVRKSKFLVPIQEADEVNSEGKKEIKLMVLNAKDKDPAIPIFTDTFTMAHFLGKNSSKAVTLNIEQLLELNIPDNTRGFLINPNGAGLLLNKEQLGRIVKDFPNEAN